MFINAAGEFTGIEFEEAKKSVEILAREYNTPLTAKFVVLFFYVYFIFFFENIKFSNKKISLFFKQLFLTIETVCFWCRWLLSSIGWCFEPKISRYGLDSHDQHAGSRTWGWFYHVQQLCHCIYVGSWFGSFIDEFRCWKHCWMHWRWFYFEI